MLYSSLEETDQEIHSLIQNEEKRQFEGLELIASENFTSRAVLETTGSILTNKYSEGQVGQRYYGGNENIDAIESLCKQRALSLFDLDPEVWDVNVQVLSGSVANLAVYMALAGKDGRILGMDLPSGGHLSHGYKTPTRKISASSIFFNSESYKCCADGKLDYTLIESKIKEFKPDVLICGATAFPRDFNYQKLKEIAGDAYLMMDMSHISGFIATKLMNNPFEYCDVVTTTTHKLLRGPRSALIFYKKRKERSLNGELQIIDVKSAIDFAVFPGLLGGPHNQKIAAVAVALKQASSENYKQYAKQVLKNAKALSDKFTELGYLLYTGGTDCHMVVIVLDGVGGAEVERVCELANISVNRNCVVNDKSPLRPSGIRIGTPAMTTRGLNETDFEKVAEFVHEGIVIAKNIKKQVGKAKVGLDEFTKLARENTEIQKLKERVLEFVSRFPIPK